MINYPDYIIIDNVRYNINTDFRYAIICNQIAENKNIDDYERALGIICTLFGKKALDNKYHYEKLFKGAERFLLCGKEKQIKNNEKPDMDYIKDMDLIETSFFSDYGIELEKIQMHWWKFNKLMNGLSNSELGNCCILNRIRNIRNIDLSTIKDTKEKEKIAKIQEYYSLDKKELTEEEKQNINEFYAQIERK